MPVSRDQCPSACSGMQASTGSRPGSAGGAGVGRPPVQEAGRRLGPSCVAFGELGRREGKVLLGEPFRARQLAYLLEKHGRYRQAVQAHRPPSQDCEPLGTAWIAELLGEYASLVLDPLRACVGEQVGHRSGQRKLDLDRQLSQLDDVRDGLPGAVRGPTRLVR